MEGSRGADAFDIRRDLTDRSCPVDDDDDDEPSLPEELDLGGVGSCLRGLWFFGGDVLVGI